MGATTGIEWATSTFNPWWGCARVSRACDGCYAETIAHRFGVRWGRTADRRLFGDQHWTEPIRWNRRAAATGEQWRGLCDCQHEREPAGRGRWPRCPRCGCACSLPDPDTALGDPDACPCCHHSPV